jgi:CHASE3 domain sensor protein
MVSASKFNEILEQIETLSSDDQEILIDLVKRRLIERRRDEIADNIALAHQEHQSRNVFRGSVEDVIAELNN